MSDAPARSHGTRSIAATPRPRGLEAGTDDATWRAEVVTLLPEAFPGILGLSLTGRALADGLWSLRPVDLRRHGLGRHRNVDDTPTGGGAGMVLRADVMAAALGETDPRLPLIYLSPRGRRFDQEMARRLAAGPGVRLICGRFEGLDQRLIDRDDVLEVSLGDMVLTGGEIAAMALIDAAVRLIPRVLGNQASVEEESFSHGLLEHPQYTRPAVWEDRAVPGVLLSGHHADIADWRRAEAERLTKERRPDLWRAYLASQGMDPEEDREL